ncbi:hypothetical protein INR49_023486, partial [Caranx melampygus]
MVPLSHSLTYRLQNYDATCRLAQEIAENIHERNRQQRTGGNPAKINMTLRASLQKLKQSIAQLKEGLLRASSSRRMYPCDNSEADRRQNLIDDLLTREKQLNATFKGDITEPEPSRSSLMAGGAGASESGAANPWLSMNQRRPEGYPSGRSNSSNKESLKACHSYNNRTQDAGLDALAAVISRQKIMGQEIGNELDEQNEIIDDLAHLVDKTDDRIRNETRRVKLVETKSASCGHIFGTDPQELVPSADAALALLVDGDDVHGELPPLTGFVCLQDVHLDSCRVSQGQRDELSHLTVTDDFQMNQLGLQEKRAVVACWLSKDLILSAFLHTLGRHSEKPCTKNGPLISKGAGWQQK